MQRKESHEANQNQTSSETTDKNQPARCTMTHKFLGLLMDQELRFKEHANYALKKGEAYISQYRRLTRPTKGVTDKHMRT
jgi:hypothetical protein